MIGYDYFDEVQQWYVVFQDRRKPRSRIIHWLLHDAFVHCLLVREVNGQTMVIDPLQWGIGVKVYEQPLDEFLIENAPQASAILSFVADYRRLEGYVPRGVYTCVTAIKAILGLRRCLFVQTPFSLYRYLLRYQHTVVVKPYIPYIARTI